MENTLSTNIIWCWTLKTEKPVKCQPEDRNRDNSRNVVHIKYLRRRQEVKFLTKHQALKTYLLINLTPRQEDIMGSGGVAPRILNLSPTWMWVVSFTYRSLYSRGNIPRYPLYRRLGGPQSWYGRGGEEKISLSLPGIETRPSSPQAKFTVLL